jgi:hypothetical protein
VPALRERAEAMVRRVSLETGFLLGEQRGAAAGIAAAVAAALAARDAAVHDDHDPRLLHPARTVLILLSDAASRDADALAAAAFVDSVDGGLGPGLDALEAAAGAAARRVAEAVPALARENALEALVTAPPAAAVIALAERLDHARHLHLRPDLAWHEFHAGVEAVCIPAAARLNPMLARRFERWAEAFRARRLLRRGSNP